MHARRQLLLHAACTQSLPCTRLSVCQTELRSVCPVRHCLHACQPTPVGSEFVSYHQLGTAPYPFEGIPCIDAAGGFYCITRGLCFVQTVFFFVTNADSCLLQHSWIGG